MVEKLALLSVELLLWEGLTWKSSILCSLRLELGLGTRKTRNSARNRLVPFFSTEDTLKRKTLEVIPLGQTASSSRRSSKRGEEQCERDP